jgi:tetratricopeptide (TPR) repeat protein
MNRQVSAVIAAAVAAAGIGLGGCGGEKTIELRYERPAEYQIPADVRRVGIARFGGQSAEDRKWGDIASDRLAAALEVYNRKYGRYQLVERKRLKAILDEKDLQLAISDSASAVQAGKIAKVDAMIYGTAAVTTRDERLTRSTFDPLRRSMRTVPYTRRYCLAALNFTMDDINTGKTLATVSVSREFDSETDKEKSAGASMAKMMGFGGDKLPPADQVVSGLIEQCVQAFLHKISPHEVVVTETLRGGKTKAVKTGNKLAAAGDYAEALACYQQAMAARGDDHEAVFNAGVMYEVTGRFEQAEACYDRAFKMEPKEQYVFARKRVRLEGAADAKP